MSHGLFYPITLIQGVTLDLPFSITDVVFDDYEFVGQIQPNDATLTGEPFAFVIDESDVDIMHAIMYNTSTLSASIPHTFEIRMTHKTSKIVTSLLYGSVEVKPTIISPPVRPTYIDNSDGFIALG